MRRDLTLRPNDVISLEFDADAVPTFVIATEAEVIRLRPQTPVLRGDCELATAFAEVSAGYRTAVHALYHKSSLPHYPKGGQR